MNDPTLILTLALCFLLILGLGPIDPNGDF